MKDVSKTELKRVGETFDQIPAYESMKIDQTICPKCGLTLNTGENAIELDSAYALYECSKRFGGCNTRFMLLKGF